MQRYCLKFGSRRSANAEATIRHSAPLESPEVGAAIVPARPLQRFVASVQGPITLELRAREMVAAADKVRVAFHTIAAEHWLSATEPSGEAVLLSEDDVSRIGRILYAAAPAASNPILSSVHFEPGWAVALDGYRLAAARISADAPTCVIPVEVAAAAVSEAGEVEVVTDGNRVRLSSGSTTCVAATVAGPYPDWRLPLPASGTSDHRLAASRVELLRAVRRAETLGFNATGVSFTKVELSPTSETSIALRSVDASMGEAVEELEGTLTLPHIAFNASYLRQTLEQATSDRVEFRLSEGTKPAVLDEDDHLQLVMPIRG